MKQKKPIIWILLYLALVVGAFSTIVYQVVKIDPFFHFHKPDTSLYFYSLDNQRSQNDGITKHFEYDALITGSSMTENFKTTEMDEIFGTKSIKVPYAGGTYKEINDNLKIALQYNPELKTVVRGLDMNFFITDKDEMRQDLGEFPTYMYDENVLNDVNYIFNRDIIFGRVYPMMKAKKSSENITGITSFDQYSCWAEEASFGKNVIKPDGFTKCEPGVPHFLSEEEKKIVILNITQNVTSLAEEYPNVTFYYFFTPYSAIWWQGKINDGTIYKYHEAEELIIEQILQHENIHLFSFNNMTEITMDLNNYWDWLHYGPWINSLMLRYMHEDKCRLTKDNYQKYLEKEWDYYLNFDYESLNNQVDYEDDYYMERYFKNR